MWPSICHRKWSLSQIHHVFESSVYYAPNKSVIIFVFSCRTVYTIQSTQCMHAYMSNNKCQCIMLNKLAIGFAINSIYRPWCEFLFVMAFIETISIQFKSRWLLEQLNWEHVPPIASVVTLTINPHLIPCNIGSNFEGRVRESQGDPDSA